MNIGLVRDGRPALGVVGIPAYGEMFGGIVGARAWRRDGAGERAIAARHPPPEGLAVMASRHYATDPRIAAYLAGRTIGSITNICSSG